MGRITVPLRRGDRKPHLKHGSVGPHECANFPNHLTIGSTVFAQYIVCVPNASSTAACKVKQERGITSPNHNHNPTTLAFNPRQAIVMTKTPAKIKVSGQLAIFKR